MQKENIIDLNHEKSPNINTNQTDPFISEELQKAIQNLIYRLRELGPLSS